MKKGLLIFIILFCVFALGVSVRGMMGNPSPQELLSLDWRDNGPFELSPERGRFALTYSVIEEGSVFFPIDIARFVIPDLGYINGNYVSLFAPLLSFSVIPGYLIGKYLGAAQVGTFAIVSLFAILNVILIRSISIKLGANNVASTIGALIFLFATPAFAYAVNLYQHHLTTFLILLSIYSLLRFKNVMALIVVFFSFAASVPLDYPNLFIMSPIAAYAISKVFIIEKLKEKLLFKINIVWVFAPFIMIIPLLFFLWFNNASYGSPTQTLGSSAITSVKAIDDNGQPKNSEQQDTIIEKQSNVSGSEKSAIGFFETRDILNGFYIHLISPDRGILYYAPIVLFGILGFFLALKKKVKLISLLAAIIGANILLYSMWGDPWGGWAFGSRYLIPSYAILSLFIALLLTYWKKSIWLMAIFALIAFYSIAVNTLGAITTSAMPPQVQVLELERISGIVQKYTYERNWDFLLSGHSKSFVYQEYLRDVVTPLEFYIGLTTTICSVIAILIILLALKARREKNA